MNEEGRKSITRGNIPRWEAELWSFVSSGDGICCPLSERCRIGEQGGWCPDATKENINQLLDERRFNLDSYNFIKAEGKRRCRLCQLVERLAVAHLKKYFEKYLEMRAICRPPISTGLITLLDQRYTVEIRQLPLKAYHGAIWYQKDGWIIQVKDSDDAPTKRFTLFHESFHILAHSRTSPVFRKRGRIVGTFNEMLADHFAMCVLLPRDWVAEKWAEVKDLDRMVEIFAVSKSAICIRLRQLGLI